jgi:hypothetical protein
MGTAETSIELFSAPQRHLAPLPRAQLVRRHRCTPTALHDFSRSTTKVRALPNESDDLSLEFVVGSAVALRSRNPMVPVNDWQPITDYADVVSSPSLSPDGRMLAFLRGPRTVYGPGYVYAMVLPKAQGPTLQLTHDPARETMDPAFTPDGPPSRSRCRFETWTVPVNAGNAQLWLPNASVLQIHC